MLSALLNNNTGILGYGILPENPNAPAEVEDEQPAVTSGEETGSYPAQTFVEHVGDMSVIVNADEGAFPEGTTMEVKAVDSAEIMDAVTDAVEKEVVRVQAVDITFRDADGNEIEPKIPVRVTMRENGVAGLADEQVVVHMTDEGKTSVVDEAREAGSRAASETDSFSVYALVYTVDFEYQVNGKVYTFNLPGGEKITLAELAEILGILENSGFERVDDFLAQVQDVRFSNEDLVKVVHPAADLSVRQAVEELGVEQVFSVWLEESEKDTVLSDTIHAGEWALISLLPFDTVERLTITMKDGQEILVKVTDDATGNSPDTSDLGRLISGVTIKNVEQNDTGNDGTVRVGRSYSMEFSFAEFGDLQFAAGNSLTYQIPQGIKMLQPSGTFNIEYSGKTYSGNTYTYDEATNTITVNFSDTVKALVSASQDTQFTININGEFTGEQTHFEFGNGYNKDYTINRDHDVSVNKTGSYNSGDNKVWYNVVASSDGRSEDVVITDTVTGTALNYDRGSIRVNGRAEGDGYRIVESDDGFVVTFDSMNDQETISITYSASVDFGELTGRGTVQQTGNTVKIEAKDDPPVEKTTDVSNQIDYNPLSKSAGTASGSGNTKTLPWTITVNEQQLKSVAGTTITDRNNSADVMHYSGSGIRIAVMDGTRTVRVINKSWEDLGIDPATATGWSYTIPADDDDLNNTYKYVITYETTVDTTGKITDFSVNNGVQDDEGHSGGGSGTVPPGDDKITLEKSNPTFSAATSDWEISFNVPKNGLTSAVVTDTFPRKDYSGPSWKDMLSGAITVEGLLDGESYAIDSSDDSKVVITFYKTGEKTDENRGLLPSSADRTVKVKLSTSNDSDWVQTLTGDGHTNTAYLDVNGQVVTDTATSHPRSEGIAKIGSAEGTRTIDGREYPVFKYTLKLFDVTDASFDENDELTIVDTYNGEYLKLLVLPELGEGADWGELRWSEPYGNNAYQGGRTTYVDNNGTLTITANKREFSLDNNNMYKPVYEIYYYLIVKDETALNDLEAASIGAADHKVPLENIATWGDFHDDVTIDYEYPALDKEQLGHADSKGMVKYKIVINPDKLELNGGQPMEMQDTATNITIDYSTIVIETEPTAEVSYYYRGYTGYYTIPDRTKVTITYSARVIGNGDVPISNDANMKGFKDSTSSTEHGDSSGSGNLNIEWVVVYKHEWHKMDKGLVGAVYVLTDEAGNPLLYPASAADATLIGKPITFTTGEIDLNELPDGTRLADEENKREGYAWIYLDKEKTGLALQKGVTYYFKEYEAPKGFQKDDTIFNFTIAEHPDYDEWEYHKGDILRLADSAVEGNLEIRKTFDGAENLTDTQKEQITFKITAVDGSGNPIRIPYAKDREDNTIYAPVEGLEISYADFENGVYKLDALPNGTYTVTETNAVLGGYEYVATTYTVDGETGTAEDLSGSVIISDKTAHTFEYTNTYRPLQARINIVKKDETGEINLYGATFQLYKNDGTAWSIVADHQGLTANGEFTIDYENRMTGVTLTDLAPGQYYIKETKAPADYQLDETPFYFTVNADNTVSGGSSGTNVTFANSSTADMTATVTDKLSHTYTFTKVDDLKLSKKLSGAKFVVAEVTSFNNDGSFNTSVTNYWEYTTGKDGTFVIDADALHLEANKLYVVWESEAPAGYEKNNKIYAFYLGNLTDVTPSPARLGQGYPDASIVSLANGPQKAFVPNTETSMDLFVKKVWYKSNGEKEYDVAPASWGIDEIEVKLYQKITNSHDEVVSVKQYPDSETTFKLTLGGGGQNSWFDYKWTDLPTGDSVNTADPLTYSYYVEEVVPEGFNARYSLIDSEGSVTGNFNAAGSDADASQVTADAGHPNIEIMNAPDVVSMNVKKVWLDDGQNRPQKIDVRLCYYDKNGAEQTPSSADVNGSQIDVQLNAENGWAYEWPRVFKGYPDDPRTYFVKETRPEDYESQGYISSVAPMDEDGQSVITNTKYSSDKLKVKKVWLNADGTEMTTPPNEKVTLQLQKEEGISGSGHIVKVRTWTNYFQWGYSEQEVEVADGGNLSLSLASGSNIYLGEPEDNSNLLGNSSASYTASDIRSDDLVLNFWAGPSDYLNCSVTSHTELEVTWSGNITDVTTADGIKLNGNDLTADQIRVTLNSGNSWGYTWDALQAPSGKTYRYSVREVEVPAGFEVSYENNDGIQTGIMYVKNTVSEYTRVTAYKKWLDASGAEMGAAPSGAEVVFTLYQDGRKTSKTVTLNGEADAKGENEPWVATFEGLERYKADGQTPHEYTVRELTGYTGYAAVKDDNGDWVVTDDSNATTQDNHTIYNKKVRQLSVTKKWLDQSGEELNEAPNGSVIIDLYEEDQTEPVASITLDGRVDPHGEETPWVATFSGLEDSTVYVVKERECTVANFALSNIWYGNAEPEEKQESAESGESGDGAFTVTNKQTEQTKIDMTIVKVDAEDMTTPLSGAQFTLKKLDPAGKGSYLTDDAEVTLETESNGRTTVSDVEDGYYEVSETKIPDGYVVIDGGKFYIHVQGTDVTLLTWDPTKPVTEWGQLSNSKLHVDTVTDPNAPPVAITVGNTAGQSLPVTGGMGTQAYTALGAVLSLGSVLMYGAMRRRRKSGMDEMAE